MGNDYNKMLYDCFHEWVVSERLEGKDWRRLENLCVSSDQAEMVFCRLRGEKNLPDEVRFKEWKNYIQAEKKRESATILIAIFDRRSENREKLAGYLKKYGIQRRIDVEKLWFQDDGAAEKLKKYAVGFHLAFISLDDADAIKIGMNIYDCNPDCLICYYREKGCRLLPLLHSRPYEFYTWEQGEKIFFQKLDRMIFQAAISQGCFCYDTKSVLYCYPVNNILYFQSNLKYVHIYTVLGNDAEIYAKLSDIENALCAGTIWTQFVRIHQSSIVNRKYIQGIDKQRHDVKLTTGGSFHISDAYYQGTLKALRKS